MRIAAINPTLQQGVKTNFKGLWGKEKVDNVESSYYDGGNMCEMGTNHFITTKTYYPFKNETAEDIKKIVKKNTKSDSYSFDTYGDMSTTVNETKVKVMPKLDITEGEYNKYKNDDLLSKDEHRVEDKLKLAGLKEYLIRNMRRK